VPDLRVFLVCVVWVLQQVGTVCPNVGSSSLRKTVDRSHGVSRHCKTCVHDCAPLAALEEASKQLPLASFLGSHSSRANMLRLSVKRSDFVTLLCAKRHRVLRCDLSGYRATSANRYRQERARDSNSLSIGEFFGQGFIVFIFPGARNSQQFAPY
jgi:hypothetical protein